MSPLAYDAWYALAAALFVLALLVGGRRERWVLSGVAGASLAVPFVLAAVVMRHTGYGLQGRYVLAFSVVVPLLAGDVVFRHRRVLIELGARSIVVPFAAVAAGVQADGLYTNAHRFAVGVQGPWIFVHDAVWAPPGGWWLSLVVMAAGSALLVLAAPLEGRLGRRAAGSESAAAAAHVSR